MIDDPSEPSKPADAYRDNRRDPGRLGRRPALIALVTSVAALLTGCSDSSDSSDGSDGSKDPLPTAAAKAAEPGRGPVQDMTGRLTLNPVQGTEIKSDSGQTEAREGRMIGTIDVDVDGGRTGLVTFLASASTAPGAAPPPAFHAWGTVEAELDATACTGSFGWAFFADPRESGGALQLRCEDGTVLGARLSVTAVEGAPAAGGTWTISAALEDGYYAAP